MTTVKLLGMSGSPRNMSTYRSLEIALSEAAKHEGVETEIVALKGMDIAPCNHCNYCKKHDSLCIIDDDMQQLYPKLKEADAFLFASPVYVMSVTPQLHALFTRMRCLHKLKGGVLRNKLASAISVGGTRHGGQEMTVSAIAHACLTRGIIFVGNEPGNYTGAMVWSKDNGRKGVDDDEIGCESLINVGNRLAEVSLCMKAGVESRS